MVRKEWNHLRLEWNHLRQVDGPPLTEEELKLVMKKFDKDGNGKISRRELRVGLRNLGVRFACLRARRAIGHADANGDGAVSDEEMNELAKYVSKWGISLT